MHKLFTPALLVALAAASGTASAQYYGQPSTEQVILQQILDQVIGTRYSTNTRYRTYEEQQLFREADTNRDGILTQYEVEAYRQRMGYDRNSRYGNRYNDNRYRRDPVFPVRSLDTNRDGYISRNEFRQFLRMLDRQGYDYFYQDYDNRRR